MTQKYDDILNTIKSKQEFTPAQRKDAVTIRAGGYDVIDIVQMAALQGVTYAENFGTEVAEGLIRSNTISMVTKVLDQIDQSTTEEQDESI
jgi:hypothetical protein